MIGKVVDIFDEERKVCITHTDGVSWFSWNKEMDDDFQRLKPDMEVDFIQVSGFITRILPLNKNKPKLTPDQKKQLAIIMQSCMKVASEQVPPAINLVDFEPRIELIKNTAYDLMKFIDSKTLHYLSGEDD